MRNNRAQHVNRRTKKNHEQLKYDFMPQMLEIVEKPAHVGGKVVVGSLVSLLVVGTLWASLSRLDIVTSAPGKIESVGGGHTVMATTSGKISKVDVQPGDPVKQGQAMLFLEPSSLDVDVADLNAQLSLNESQLDLYGITLGSKDVELLDSAVQSAVQQSAALAIQRGHGPNRERFGGQPEGVTSEARSLCLHQTNFNRRLSRSRSLRLTCGGFS